MHRHPVDSRAGAPTNCLQLVHHRRAQESLLEKRVDDLADPKPRHMREVEICETWRRALGFPSDHIRQRMELLLHEFDLFCCQQALVPQCSHLFERRVSTSAHVDQLVRRETISFDSATNAVQSRLRNHYSKHGYNVVRGPSATLQINRPQRPPPLYNQIEEKAEHESHEGVHERQQCGQRFHLCLPILIPFSFGKGCRTPAGLEEGAHATEGRDAHDDQ
mmetsp:Transcript_82050/g.228689  ORF Transcript_82050/g.228689 Transcript_82050/m.228689 type:complete len:220 (-) Transcript_82050:536-1195(-)